MLRESRPTQQLPCRGDAGGLRREPTFPPVDPPAPLPLVGGCFRLSGVSAGPPRVGSEYPCARSRGDASESRRTTRGPADEEGRLARLLGGLRRLGGPASGIHPNTDPTAEPTYGANDRLPAAPIGRPAAGSRPTRGTVVQPRRSSPQPDPGACGRPTPPIGSAGEHTAPTAPGRVRPCCRCRLPIGPGADRTNPLVPRLRFTLTRCPIPRPGMRLTPPDQPHRTGRADR